MFQYFRLVFHSVSLARYLLCLQNSTSVSTKIVHQIKFYLYVFLALASLKTQRQTRMPAIISVRQCLKKQWFIILIQTCAYSFEWNLCTRFKKQAFRCKDSINKIVLNNGFVQNLCRSSLL